MAFLSVHPMPRSRSNRAIATPARRVKRAAARRLSRGSVVTELPPVAPVHEVSPLQTRIRDAGGPEDHALYTCGCGCAFDAEVSCAVMCPHCGAEQTW